MNYPNRNPSTRVLASGVSGALNAKPVCFDDHDAIGAGCHHPFADSGVIMPPNTTSFEPKLRSGLVVHTS